MPPVALRVWGTSVPVFLEAHPEGMIRTCVCETGCVGYREVENICTHLGTLFDCVPGCTKMTPFHFLVSPPKRERMFLVRKSRNRVVVRCMLLSAGIMAHWIKEEQYIPLEDLPNVGVDMEFKSMAKMWDQVAMLATWGNNVARR